MSKIEGKLKELGHQLPEAKAPVANYAAFTRHGNLVFVSGQVSQIKGKLGADVSDEDGYKAATQCALSLLAQLKNACDGNLDKVKSCVKLGVFVNSENDFIKQPQIANGASDLIAEVVGKHARAAVSANSLPNGVAVEVEGIFEIS
jgi:enamine deaminase RidA (YjgF/YER057c/UK114 family)